MPRPARPCSRRTAPPVTAPTASGKPDVGAPNLTDRAWTHGGDEASIYNDVWGGRQGQMPTWEGRLSPIDLKISPSTSPTSGSPAMSALPIRRSGPARSSACSVLAALLLLAVANAHLVYVAVMSQPDCVDHVREGDAAAGPRSARPSPPVRRESAHDLVDSRRRPAAAARHRPQAHYHRPMAFDLAGGRLARPGDRPDAKPALRRGRVHRVGGDRRRPVRLRLGLHPVPGLCRLHGRGPDPGDRSLREEPAHRRRPACQPRRHDRRAGRLGRAAPGSPACCSAS